MSDNRNSAPRPQGMPKMVNKVTPLEGKRYLYCPAPLTRFLIEKETPKFVYLSQREVFEADTGEWRPAGRWGSLNLPERIRHEALNDPASHEQFWTYLDPRWIEKAKADEEKRLREDRKARDRWEKKPKGFRAYDAFGNQLGRLWAPTAEEALQKDERAVYVEYGDGFGGTAACAGKKPKGTK